MSPALLPREVMASMMGWQVTGVSVNVTVKLGVALEVGVADGVIVVVALRVKVGVALEVGVALGVMLELGVAV